MGDLQEHLLQSLPQEQAVQPPEIAMSITVAVQKEQDEPAAGRILCAVPVFSR